MGYQIRLPPPQVPLKAFRGVAASNLYKILKKGRKDKTKYLGGGKSWEDPSCWPDGRFNSPSDRKFGGLFCVLSIFLPSGRDLHIKIYFISDKNLMKISPKAVSNSLHLPCNAIISIFCYCSKINILFETKIIFFGASPKKRDKI